MNTNFEYIDILDKVSISVKEFLPTNILTPEGELTPDIEMFIGNDFTEKFDLFLKRSLDEEEYKKIEDGLLQSQETEIFLKYHDISENILLNIDGIAEKAVVFSNQYLRELNYSELVEKFGTINDENTNEISTETNINVVDTETIENDNIIPEENNTELNNEINTIDDIKIESPSNNIPAKLSTTLSLSDDDDEDDDENKMPVTNIPTVDKFIATPTESNIENENSLSVNDGLLKEEIEPTIEQPVENTTQELDLEAMRSSYGLDENSVNINQPQKNTQNDNNSIEITTPTIDTPVDKAFSGIDNLVNAQNNPNINNSLGNGVLDKLRGINFLGTLSLLLNKKIMSGLLIVLLVGGTIIYNQQKQSGIDGIKTTTQSVTEQITSKITKIDVATLDGTSVLEYMIFKDDGTMRDSESDSQRKLTTKTVDGLNSFLKQSLNKLKTDTDSLSMFADMKIRIFSINGTKTLINLTVRDFVLKRK